jgi:signal transduction histidine kinase/DNA-binding response OmpR family regulator
MYATLRLQTSYLLVLLLIGLCLLQASKLMGQDTLAQLLAKKDTVGYVDYVVNIQMKDRELYPQEALYHHLQTSIRLAEQRGDTLNALWAKYSFATFFEYSSGQEHTKQLLKLMRELEQYPKEVKYVKILAHVYSNYSNEKLLPNDSVFYYLNKSIALHSLAQDTLLLMLNYKNLSIYHKRMGSIADCIENGYIAVQLSKYAPNFYLNVENNIHLTDCLISSGRWEEAETQLLQISKWLSKIDSNKEHLLAINILRAVPPLYERLNQPEKALYYQKQYTQLLQSSLRQKWEGEIRQLEVAAKTQEKENEILALELKNQKAGNLRNQLLVGLGVVVTLVILLIWFYQFRQKYLLRETTRLKELDDFKTRLYTNITHEFRTPLTVVLGMAAQIKENPKAWLSEGVDAIIRNSKQLLDLVNQMLDLSRLESGAMPLHLQQAEIVPFLSYLTQSFQSFAASKNIQLHFTSEVNECILDFDADKLTKVVSNLISNAVKYTPKGGHIYVKIRQLQQQLELCIADTGMGIPEEQLPFIFDRFYQVTPPQPSPKGREHRYSSPSGGGWQGVEGTGIGLALTKELLQLMQGTIQVASKLGEGTAFIILLSIKRTAPVLPNSAFMTEKEILHPPVAPASSLDTSSNGDLPIALIMEDNRDVVHYLSTCLKNQYQLEVAFDGAAGIEKAMEVIPDIIISDVMMPEKDGFEVCATLKQDMRTSHIPIILLTAKADMAARLEGLEYGADVYLEKPFEKKELEVRLRKLIELRKHLQQKYQSAKLEDVSPDQESDRELLFLKQLETVLLESISNEDFRVEPDLCRAMRMSRPQLYRKIKALKDQSPSEYVRSVRMQQARHLLLTTDLNVGDIAQQVGFKEHSYFTQVYHTTFSETPIETRNQ